MKRSPRKILNDVHLRSTASRSTILNLFLNHPQALSYTVIEKKITPLFNRVTVYRTLNTFLKKGIIHKIADNVGKLKYALCDEHCSIVKHHHNHVHFKCLHCNDTLCLNQIEIPKIKLPQGYYMETADFLVQGVCAKCK